MKYLLHIVLAAMLALGPATVIHFCKQFSHSDIPVVAMIEEERHESEDSADGADDVSFDGPLGWPPSNLFHFLRPGVMHQQAENYYITSSYTPIERGISSPPPESL